MKKKFLMTFVAITAIVMFQLNLGTSSAGKDLQLSQLVQNAEACAEVGGGGYKCCPASAWCYIGGGYEMYPFYFNF